MKVRSLAWIVALTSMFAAACGGGDDGGGGGGGRDGGGGSDPPGGPTYFWVVNELNVAGANEMGIAPGFNLDGRVSDESDAQGCNKPDYTSPPPDNEPGVDNQLGPILDALGGMGVDVGMEAQMAMAEGNLVVLVEATDVDDLRNDRSVGLSLLVAARKACMTGDADCTPTWTCDMADRECRPPLDSMGRIRAGGTFDVSRASYMADGMTPLVSVTGSIVNGRFRGGPIDLMLTLPVRGAELTLRIRRAQVRFNPSMTAATQGVIGGSLNIDETVMAIRSVSTEIPESLVRSVLEGNADLDPNAEGECESISLGMTFAGVNATKGMVVTVSD
ncbi:MAG: hypothetical protein NZ898_05005 [Myxococcota bacterium]|nr:hypothetical protein [Myxococcota bacterium]